MVISTLSISMFMQCTFSGLFTLHGPSPGQLQGVVPKLMGPNVLYRNVHTGLDRKEPDPLFPIVLVQFPVPVPVPFLCSMNKPLR